MEAYLKRLEEETGALLQQQRDAAAAEEDHLSIGDDYSIPEDEFITPIQTVADAAAKRIMVDDFIAPIKISADTAAKKIQVDDFIVPIKISADAASKRIQEGRPDGSPAKPLGVKISGGGDPVVTPTLPEVHRLAAAPQESLELSAPVPSAAAEVSSAAADLQARLSATVDLMSAGGERSPRHPARRRTSGSSDSSHPACPPCQV